MKKLFMIFKKFIAVIAIVVLAIVAMVLVAFTDGKIAMELTVVFTTIGAIYATLQRKASKEFLRLIDEKAKAEAKADKAHNKVIKNARKEVKAEAKADEASTKAKSML